MAVSTTTPAIEAFSGLRRQAICKSMVMNGARIVRDGGDHSGKVNRCTLESGECVGFYAVLIDYDFETDTFGIGYRQRIPAVQVNEIALFDAIAQLIEALKSLARQATQD